jgi:hypothetical protein
MTAHVRLANERDLPPAPIYGTPVRLDLGGCYIDLGTETTGGERIVRLVLGDVAADAALSPEEARQLATELTRLADAP